jgi:hypothetical protein
MSKDLNEKNLESYIKKYYLQPEDYQGFFFFRIRMIEHIGSEIREAFKNISKVSIWLKNNDKKESFDYFLNGVCNLYEFLKKVTAKDENINDETWKVIMDSSISICEFLFSHIIQKYSNELFAHAIGSIYSLHLNAFWKKKEKNSKISDTDLDEVKINTLFPKYFVEHLRCLIHNNNLKNLIEILKYQYEKNPMPVKSISYFIRPCHKAAEYLKTSVLEQYLGTFQELLERLISLDIDTVPNSEKKKILKIFNSLEFILLQINKVLYLKYSYFFFFDLFLYIFRKKFYMKRIFLHYVLIC